MKSVLILGSLLLLSIVSFSQQRFVEAEIELSSNEIVQGFINYKNWINNPVKIKFKSSENDPVQEFDAHDLNRFTVGGDVYFSSNVDVDLSSGNINDLSETSKPELVKKRVFLRQLIGGEKGLMLYKQSDLSLQLYLVSGNSYNLLIYKKYTKNGFDNSSIVMPEQRVLENKKYVGQLMVYLNDCGDISPMVQGVPYSEKGILKLFERYYECTGKEISYIKEKEDFEFEFGLTLGATITNLKANGNSGYEYINSMKFDPSLDATFGLVLDVVFPRGKRRWSIYNDLIYTSYEITGEVNNYTNSKEYLIASSKLSMSHIKLSNQLQYTLPIRQLGLIFGAGLSNAIAIAEKENTATIEVMEFGVLRTSEGPVVPDPKSYEIGFVSELGLEYLKFHLSYRHEFVSGMSEIISLSILPNRHYFVLAYKF